MNSSFHKALTCVIDQGTSSTKAFLFDEQGKIEWTQRRKHALQRPADHHAEADAAEILQACRYLIAAAITEAKNQNRIIKSIGLAVQRSTFLFWDKPSVTPVTPALSWQDSRASEIVHRHRNQAEWVHTRTGTPLSAHFGGPKYQHLIEHNHALAGQVDKNQLWFGPLSSFLTHALTGTAAVDESIAGRSLLMDLDRVRWDEELCNVFQVNQSVLPPLHPTTGDFGNISVDGMKFPLRCVIGDQQAALMGQGGIHTGDLAMNFGTSGSVQYHAGTKPLHTNGLISSVLFSTKKERHFLLEGTINAANSLFYWLEDELKIPHEDMRWHERCAGKTTEGVFVPGFVGIAAPYWRDRFDTIRRNLDPNEPNDLIRAAMESIGFLAYDITRSIRSAAGTSFGSETVSASGGGSRPALLQFIANLLQQPVGHTAMRDRTALGVYRLLTFNETGDWDTANTDFDHVYKPNMSQTSRTKKLEDWANSLQQAGITPV